MNCKQHSWGKESVVEVISTQKYSYTVETSYSDHVCPGQIDHYKGMIILQKNFYHLIDICIFITWI